jgi:L-ribulose-5-phosphate 3-epimerase
MFQPAVFGRNDETMKIGYNTNGLAFHDPFEALHLLADTGYRSVQITIDHQWLNPNDPAHKIQLQRIKHFLSINSFSSVVDAGARFLLDPRSKYSPALLDDAPDRIQARVDFLKHCIDIASELESDCVTLASGYKPANVSFNRAVERLVTHLTPVAGYAKACGVELGFKPEPEMLIDSTGRFERLMHLFDSGLKMTMDISHLFCLSEVPVSNYIEKWKDLIVNVCVSDMQAGIHEHLELGTGQIYFPPVIESLLNVGYEQGVHVELSHHSHDAARLVKQSFDFLSPILEDARSRKFE